MSHMQEQYAKSKLDGLQCIWRDTLQYRLEESVFNRHTRQLTQLFTYLLMHKLFSSCIRRCLVSLDCDHGSGPLQYCSVLLDNIGQRTLPKIWVSPFLVCSIQPKGKTLKCF